MSSVRPLALITGVSRTVGIGASIARTLANAGWDIAFSYWRPYDASMPWGSDPYEVVSLKEELINLGATVVEIEADLSLTSTPESIFETVNREIGSVSALIMSHCFSVDSNIFSTTIESFDRHFEVNARASWLLVRSFAEQFTGEPGAGRIIGLTSDHTAENLPYGASKGAMDRIIIASATELRERGITANVINPGATDTGWMTEDLKTDIEGITLSGRIGTAQDCANLIKFLCSEDGRWINGQLLYSNGGLQ
ncbi:MAG: SDR family oxidoreductase [Spirochaetaceae bacterium]|jgi:3-oxoacyl-[acyl-carrier protein] reductase|nr:SDR family oxidoreductase [Spirochaetaceae bacterium]